MLLSTTNNLCLIWIESHYSYVISPYAGKIWQNSLTLPCGAWTGSRYGYQSRDTYCLNRVESFYQVTIPSSGPNSGNHEKKSRCNSIPKKLCLMLPLISSTEIQHITQFNEVRIASHLCLFGKSIHCLKLRVWLCHRTLYITTSFDVMSWLLSCFLEDTVGGARADNIFYCFPVR